MAGCLPDDDVGHRACSALPAGTGHEVGLCTAGAAACAGCTPHPFVEPPPAVLSTTSLASILVSAVQATGGACGRRGMTVDAFQAMLVHILRILGCTAASTLGFFDLRVAKAVWQAHMTLGL